MATNQFLAFGTATGANVMNQSDYTGLSARSGGFGSGLAPSAQVNKALRQPSAIAAAVGALITGQGLDALDNGDIDTLTNNLVAAIQAIAKPYQAPTGSLLEFPAIAPPDGAGYIECAGQALNRADYPALWTFAQGSGNVAVNDGVWDKGQFSPGNGSTTFRIPDYRGYFLRGWAHAGAVDAGRAIGISQAEDLQPHTHGLSMNAVSGHSHAGSSTDSGGSHTHGIADTGHVHGHGRTDTGNGVGSGWGGDASGALSAVGNTDSAMTGISVSPGGTHSHNLSIATDGGHTPTGTVGSTGSTETRPVNIAVLICIKT